MAANSAVAHVVPRCFIASSLIFFTASPKHDAAEFLWLQAQRRAHRGRPERAESRFHRKRNMYGGYAIGLQPPAEAGELVRQQLGNHLGDFFDLHVAQ